MNIRVKVHSCPRLSLSLLKTSILKAAASDFNQMKLSHEDKLGAKGER